jgi:hypothetical protein
MTYTPSGTGARHTLGGEHHEPEPTEKWRYTDKVDDPHMPGEMTVTVILRKVICGTELNIEQAGVPDVIPAEMCYLGWQESLAQLANLVEPDIPNG